MTRLYESFPSLKTLALGAAIAFQGLSVAACGSGDNAAPDHSETVAGLWRYTNLITSDGQEMPLTGIFLFRDGYFMQQSIFDGEPFEAQAAMAHAGPYTATEDGVALVAEQTISVAPGEEAPLTFRRSTEHDLSVTRSGSDLTLVFGSGTVQELSYLGPADGEVYPIEDGAFALVDGWFVLVQGNDDQTVNGYGTFQRSGDTLDLDIVRWAEAGSGGAINLRDTSLQAHFDGEELSLPNGRSFRVLN